MKTIKCFIFSLILISSFTSCNSQVVEEKSQTGVSDNKIEVFYFHYSRRCATCNAVEEESQKALETLYSDKVESGDITFQSINIDEESSKGITEKLKISGQTLLIVKGTNKINITNEGFMFARSNPEKLKEIIKEKIDSLL